MRTASDDSEPGFGGGRRVTTATGGGNPADAEGARELSPLARFLQNATGRAGVFGRLMRAGTTSVGATVLSHGTYVALLGAAHAQATVASTIAFLVGACFNYFVGRRFTWGRSKRPNAFRETLPYILVIACGGALSITVATLTEQLLMPHGLSNAHRTLVLEVANIASYGVVFFFKFTLLDRFVFRGASRSSAAEPASSATGRRQG